MGSCCATESMVHPEAPQADANSTDICAPTLAVFPVLVDSVAQSGDENDAGNRHPPTAQNPPLINADNNSVDWSIYSALAERRQLPASELGAAEGSKSGSKATTLSDTTPTSGSVQRRSNGFVPLPSGRTTTLTTTNRKPEFAPLCSFNASGAWSPSDSRVCTETSVSRSVGGNVTAIAERDVDNKGTLASVSLTSDRSSLKEKRTRAAGCTPMHLSDKPSEESGSS